MIFFFNDKNFTWEKKKSTSNLVIWVIWNTIKCSEEMKEEGISLPQGQADFN